MSHEQLGRREAFRTFEAPTSLSGGEFTSGDTDKTKKFLKKLDRFYKKLDFKNNEAIYYFN